MQDIRRDWNIKLDDMLEAGVHMGHGIKKWNPRMKPYIFYPEKNKGFHIINLIKTARFLSEACNLVYDAARKGKHFLIVGTKHKDLVMSAAIRARCHYVNQNWRSGMLTNWYTTKIRLNRFRDLSIKKRMGNHITKRDEALFKRQLSKLKKYLNGIKYMTRLPDIVIILDQKKEYIALKECIILGIQTICLIDTNSDPFMADFSIPVNDDTLVSIQLILNKLVFAICEGQKIYKKK